MLGYISESMYLLEDAQTLFNGIPVLCQTYGHSWELTEYPDIKECQLCHIRGYCPSCTPIAPIGAQPFYCTTHTKIREVQ
jgi:hypothetical protein